MQRQNKWMTEERRHVMTLSISFILRLKGQVYPRVAMTSVVFTWRFWWSARPFAVNQSELIVSDIDSVWLHAQLSEINAGSAASAPVPLAHLCKALGNTQKAYLNQVFKWCQMSVFQSQLATYGPHLFQSSLPSSHLQQTAAHGSRRRSESWIN